MTLHALPAKKLNIAPLLPVVLHTFGVVLANITALPDAPPLAVSVSGVAPTKLVLGRVKAMVCADSAALTAMLCVTVVAALNEALPVCVATTVHVPTNRAVS